MACVVDGIDAGHPGATGIGLQQRGQHPDEGGLAGAVGSEQSVDDAGLELEADAVERNDVAKRLRDVLGAHDGSGHGGVLRMGGLRRRQRSGVASANEVRPVADEVRAPGGALTIL